MLKIPHPRARDHIPHIPLTPIDRLLATAPPAVDWLWDGYLAPGALTLLAGQPKAGKSTFLFALLAQLVAGEPFAGRPTRRSRAVLLSEEPRAAVCEKARRFGCVHDVAVLLRQENPAPLAAAVDHVLAEARDAALLVVDTFAAWAGLAGDAENDAGAVLTALEPLQRAAGAGLAVLVVHHTRKARGEGGLAVRGSSALVGAMDILLALEAPADDAPARVLRAQSRFSATPAALRCALNGARYEVLNES